MKNAFTPISFVITIFPFLSYLAANMGYPSFGFLVYLKITVVVVSAFTTFVILVSIDGAKFFKFRSSGMALSIATMLYCPLNAAHTQTLGRASSMKVVFSSR